MHPLAIFYGAITGLFVAKVIDNQLVKKPLAKTVPTAENLPVLKPEPVINEQPSNTANPVADSSSGPDSESAGNSGIDDDSTPTG